MDFRILLVVGILLQIVWCGSKTDVVEEVSDPKAWKQLLRTRTNVMVLFSRGRNPSILKVYREAAKEVRGIGTMVLVDCEGSGQKLCRQVKAAPETHLLHHYKDGKFHKAYDRQETTKSLVRFMNDPTGDRPWEEEPSGRHVLHLDSPASLSKVLKKHKRALVMFYAPWCVYCKHMKPEYAAAAEKVKADGLGVLAAMDVVRPENAGMRTKYNITGFPTVHYFKNGKILATYEGDNKQDAIVQFMKDPLSTPTKPKDVPWSEEQSDVHHLTTENFDQFLKEHSQSLVMFYAPWCGHCKNLKPEWMKAATAQRKAGIDTVVAAVDATRETKLAERFKVKGFPTIKFFKDGEFAFDTPNLRDEKKIVEFLLNPKEPPPAPPPEPAWADTKSEVVHLNSENFKSQLRSKRHALVMFYAPWCGHCKAAKPEFEAAAEQLKDELRMVLAAVDCVDNAAICKQYDVKGYPTFKYFKYQKDATSYDGGRKASDFVNFLRNLEPGSTMKSSETIDASTTLPPPAMAAEKPNKGNNKEGEGTPVYQGWDKLLHITDENYQDLFKKHKHLFILFHAKWCANCTEVKPKFAAVAGRLSAESQAVTMAACDTDKAPNMVDLVMVDSLPTMLYVRDGKAGQKYLGERTEAGISQFLTDIKTKLKDEL